MSTEQKTAEANPVETTKAVAPTNVEKAIVHEKTLEERIMGVMKDVIDTKLAAMEKALDVKLDVILKSKEVEVEQALRKGFGLEQDPVVHMSDLITYGRKIALEKADTDKRTPAPVEKGGPEGKEPSNPIAGMFAKARKDGVV